MEDADYNWLCPWCGKVALPPTEHTVVSYSKTCECGALALAAPPWDTDEIIDDAINIFGIADGYLTPYNDDRIAGLEKVGVEIAEGTRVSSGGSHPIKLRVLWFRRRVGHVS